MNDIFPVNQTTPNDLKKRNVLQTRKTSSVRHVRKPICYIAPKKLTLVYEKSNIEKVYL